MLTKVLKDVVKELREESISLEEFIERLEAAHYEFKWEVMHAIAHRAIEYLAESGPGRNVKITITQDFLELDCGSNKRNSAESISAGIFAHLSNDPIDYSQLTVEVLGNIIIVKTSNEFDEGIIGKYKLIRGQKPMKATMPPMEEDEDED